MKKIGAIIMIFALIALAAPAQARHYGCHRFGEHHHGGGLAAGIVGGLVGGLIIGEALRPPMRYRGYDYDAERAYEEGARRAWEENQRERVEDAYRRGYEDYRRW